VNITVVEGGNDVKLISCDNRVVVESIEPRIIISHEGMQGVPGQGNILILEASHPISALRAVTGAGVGTIRYALPGDPVIGISVSAAGAGGNVNVMSSGVVDVTGLSLTSGAPVFLSAADGILTSTPPPSGPLQRIGVKDATAPSLSFVQSSPFNRI
jgi:hypothetical protein